MRHSLRTALATLSMTGALTSPLLVTACGEDPVIIDDTERDDAGNLITDSGARMDADAALDGSVLDAGDGGDEDTDGGPDAGSDAGMDGGADSFIMGSLVGPRPNATCASIVGALVIAPPSNQDAATLDDMINAATSNRTICLTAGIHRADEAIVLKSGQQILGEAGAIVDGSVRLATWTVAGNNWYAAMSLPAAPQPFTGCDTGDQCNEPNDAWFNGQLLRRASKAKKDAGLSANEVYFDYANDRVYVGQDPTGQKVIASRSFPNGLFTDRPSPGGTAANNVTIRNLTIQHVGTPAQVGAIDARSTWTVENNEIQWVHGVCLMAPSGNGSISRRNTIHDCGQLGIKGRGGDDPTLPSHAGGHLFTVAENEVARTNYAGYRVGWEAGASKFSRSDGILIQKNWFHDHPQAGVWIDVNGINVSIDGNWITDNGEKDYFGIPIPSSENLGRGVFVEISCNVTVKNNVLLNNGRTSTRGMHTSAGVLVSESHTVDVFSNLIRGNGDGVVIKEQMRESTDGYSGAEFGTKGFCAKWNAQGNAVTDISGTPATSLFYQAHMVQVHDNDIELVNEGQSVNGAVHDYASTLYNASRAISFEKNDYSVPTGTSAAAWFRWGIGGSPQSTASMAWTAWKTAGFDAPMGTLTAKSPSSTCATPTPDALAPTKIEFALTASSSPIVLWARITAPSDTARRVWYIDPTGCASSRSTGFIGATGWVKLGERDATTTAESIRLVRGDNGVIVSKVIAVSKADACGGDSRPTGPLGADCPTAIALTGLALP